MENNDNSLYRLIKMWICVCSIFMCMNRAKQKSRVSTVSIYTISLANKSVYVTKRHGTIKRKKSIDINGSIDIWEYLIDTLTLFWIYRKRSWDSSFDFQSHFVMNVGPSIPFFFSFFSGCLSNDESHKSMELIMCITIFFFRWIQNWWDVFPPNLELIHPIGCSAVYIHYMYHFALLRETIHICVCAYAFVNVNEYVKRALHWNRNRNHEHTHTRGHASTHTHK